MPQVTFSSLPGVEDEGQAVICDSSEMALPACTALPTFPIIIPLFSAGFSHLLEKEAALHSFRSSIIGTPANRNPLALAGLSQNQWEAGNLPALESL